ncbi:MAG: T9SS type A sorting domain-containing protein, partial [Elusimicrobia bacterium]|nr:T9SS type A sorting domain-containing protein [Elusimicrobiota bacterium]
EGKIKKDQTVSNAVVSVVETAGAGAGDPAVRVTIPPGVVNTASATLSVIANPSITTAAPAGQTMVGSAIKIGLSNGQTALTGTAAIVMTYPDTVRFPSLLQIYYLDEATGAWSRDFTTTVDAASRTVTGNTPHFSTFVLMLGTAFSPNLDSVQVYPVPFKPNGTNPDEGKPFTHGDANSGIIFANLASASEIKIYTLTGRLVSRLDSPTIAGTVRWDARNQDGRDVASGAYFAVITAPGQKSVVKKLVVIR